MTQIRNSIIPLLQPSDAAEIAKLQSSLADVCAADGLEALAGGVAAATGSAASSSAPAGGVATSAASSKPVDGGLDADLSSLSASIVGSSAPISTLAASLIGEDMASLAVGVDPSDLEHLDIGPDIGSDIGSDLGLGGGRGDVAAATTASLADMAEDAAGGDGDAAAPRHAEGEAPASVAADSGEAAAGLGAQTQSSTMDESEN